MPLSQFYRIFSLRSVITKINHLKLQITENKSKVAFLHDIRKQSVVRHNSTNMANSGNVPPNRRIILGTVRLIEVFCVRGRVSH